MNWWAATFVLALQLLFICWVDFTKMIIPNQLNLSLLITGLIVRLVLFNEAPLSILIKPIAVYCVFRTVAKLYAKLRGHQGLGRGDVKFLAAASVWIDSALLPLLVLIASLSGLAYVLTVGGTQRGILDRTRFPFGPHLALGLLITWVLSHYWEI